MHLFAQEALNSRLGDVVVSTILAWLGDISGKSCEIYEHGSLTPVEIMFCRFQWREMFAVTYDISQMEEGES